MKLSIPGLKFAALAAWLSLMPIARSAPPAEGSLTDLDFENSELKVAAERILGENKQLRDALANTEKTLADMRKTLGAANAETEVFKRQFTELKLRMEALGLETAGGGTAKLEQRLLAAVSDLRIMTAEKKDLQQKLVQLADAAALYARGVTAADPEARLGLETAIRNANGALSAGTEAAAPASTITDGKAISVKEDLSLVVMNIGTRQGVKVGMPFQVTRGNQVIGNVQVVDVRDKIAGAVIQNLSSEKDPIKVGDRLRVAARQ